MLMSYATKRDASGNRYLLIVDTDKKQYSTTSTRWYSSEDFIEVKKTDRRKLLDSLRESDFEEVNHMIAGIQV